MQVHTLFSVSPLSRAAHSSYPTTGQNIEKTVFKLHFIPFLGNIPIRAEHLCYLLFVLFFVVIILQLVGVVDA